MKTSTLHALLGQQKSNRKGYSKCIIVMMNITRTSDQNYDLLKASKCQVLPNNASVYNGML